MISYIMNLVKKKCVPCEGWEKPMVREDIGKYLKLLKGEWEVVDDKKIKRRFNFKDFREAMDFVNRLAEIAEAEGHHPDLHIYYNKVTVVLTTHAIKGLSENDFILAAKAENLA